MGFHRLVVPTYNGGLPASYDFINDPVANGDAGVAAAVDGKKGSGTNEGTYFAALTEPATSSNQNRSNAALAENCDILDDIVRTSVPRPSTESFTSGGADTQQAMVGDVFVGRSGVPVNQSLVDGLVQVVESSTFLPLTGTLGIPIRVNQIRDSGDAGNVVGTEADGFHTGPIVVFDQTLPAATDYRLIHTTRGTVTDVSDPAHATGDMGYLEALAIASVRSGDAARSISFKPSLQAWANGDEITSTNVQQAIDEIVADLQANLSPSGTLLLGIETHTSALDTVGGYSILAGTLHAHLEAIADRYLDSTSTNTSQVWAGTYQYTAGGTVLEFTNAGTHLLGPSINNLNIQAGAGNLLWLRGQAGAAEFEVDDDALQVFPAVGTGNLSFFNANTATIGNVAVELNLNKQTDANIDFAFTITRRTGSVAGTPTPNFHFKCPGGRDSPGINNDGGNFRIETGVAGVGGTLATGLRGGFDLFHEGMFDHDGTALGVAQEKRWCLSNEVDDGETITDWYISPFGILPSQTQEVAEITILANDNPEAGSSPSVAKYVIAWNRDAASGMFSGTVDQLWTHNDNGAQPQTLTATGTGTLPRIAITRTGTSGNIQITAFIHVMRATKAD